MFIGFYWSKREESREACGLLLFDTLHTLSSSDSVLSKWQKKGHAKTKSYEAIDVEPISLAKLLRSNRNDCNLREIHELGFSAGFWNGCDDFPVSINATLGGYSDYVRNSLVIQLPSRTAVERRFSDEKLRMLFKKLIERIQPDDAVITSNAYLDKHGGMVSETGWLVYSSRSQSLIERESMTAL